MIFRFDIGLFGTRGQRDISKKGAVAKFRPKSIFVLMFALFATLGGNVKQAIGNRNFYVLSGSSPGISALTTIESPSMYSSTRMGDISQSTSKKRRAIPGHSKRSRLISSAIS